MTPADLADLHKRCFTTPRPWSATEFEAFLRDPHVLILGDATAFALGRVIADEAELLTIAVAPEQRRKGLARRLLADFEQAASGHGALTCFLEVAAGNAPAIALYRGAKYTQTGRRRGYYRLAEGATEDALILSRRLDGR
jgi:ribosomal-protein-alanine N-acetyltransferase